MTSERNNLFLFKALPSDSPLKRDEPILLSRLFCAAIFIIAMIDIVVIIFFVKTNTRIEAVRRDNFTEVVLSSVIKSESSQEDLGTKAKEIIRKKNLSIKEYVSHLKFDSKSLEQIDFEKIELKHMRELQVALLEVENEKNGVDLHKLKSITQLYQRAEEEMKELNNYLMPIDTFNMYQERVEGNLKNVLEEIKSNLDIFLDQLVFLAQEQNINQKELLIDIQKSLDKFQQIYSFVYQNGKYTKLNNYYDIEFIEFDGNYIPFSVEFDNGRFGAQLSKPVKFDIRMPRVYYCTVNAYIESINVFNIKFQYIDRVPDPSGKDQEKEIIIFESEPLAGGYQRTVSYSEIKIFNLPTGKHTLYYRIVSENGASSLYINQSKMVCLSYRSFIENAKKVEFDEDF